MGNQEGVAIGAVFVPLDGTKHLARRSAGAELRLLVADVVVGIGVDLVFEFPAVAQTGVEPDVFEIRLLVLVIVFAVQEIEMVGGNVVLQAEVAAEQVDLLLGHGAGVAEADLVHAAQHGDRGVLANRLQVFDVIGIALHVGIGAVAVRFHALVAEDRRGAAERGQQAGVELEVTQPGAETAGTERRHERHRGARILRVERHGPAKGSEADGAGGARAAVDHDLADQLRREVTRGVVTVGIVVAEGNPVEGHIVAAVINAANGGMLGLAQARAVGLDVGHARGEGRDRRIVRRRRDIVGDILERQDRLRLAGVKFAVGRCLGEGGVAGRRHLQILQAKRFARGRSRVIGTGDGGEIYCKQTN